MIESWMFYEKSIRIEMEKSATKNSLKCYRKRKWKKKDALIFLVNKSPSFVNIISSHQASKRAARPNETFSPGRAGMNEAAQWAGRAPIFAWPPGPDQILLDNKYLMYFEKKKMFLFYLN